MIQTTPNKQQQQQQQKREIIFSFLEYVDADDG